MRNKFAFIKLGSHHTRTRVMDELVRQFPLLKVDLIDIGDLVKADKGLILVNMFYILREYGFEIITGRKKIRECFWRTSYMFKKIKQLVSGKISRDEHVFSFQTQSLFDASKSGVPHYVYTDHTHLTNLSYPWFREKDLYGRRWIDLERTVYDNARLVFTRSSNITRSVIDDYACSPDKVVCVYVGSGVEPNSDINPGEYDKKNVLFVGLDWERKGGPELVAAFERVLRAHPTARLTIVGCSPNLDIPNCEVVGRVSHEEVGRYYKKASVFCLPTRREPFGIVFLEAFSYGLPVVATGIGAIPDFVMDGETGYTVKPGDIEQLAEVLVDLLGNRKKSRVMGENGRRLIENRYNWQDVGTEIARNIKATLENDDAWPDPDKNPVIEEKVAKRFAFVTRGGHPSKDKVLQTLEEHFPDLPADVIHVGALVKRNKIAVPLNLLFIFKEYGWEILIGRKKVGECFWRTTYIFKKVKALVADHISPEKHMFSFQYQSLIDGSVPGVPNYVYTDHTHLANKYCPYFDIKDLYSQRWIELEQTIYQNAKMVFTRSSDVSMSMVRDYGCPPEKVACVYSGSNVGTDFRIDPEKYRSGQILFVGFDWERKGGPELVEAFKKVLQVHPTARLIIAGCSPKISVPNCEVLGKLTLESLNELYEKASVFCLPTKLDPSFPIAYLEAFAHGLPVVGTNIEGIPDVVREGDTGYLVEPGEVDSLAAVLIDLIGDPEKCRYLGENGRRLVLETYNWEKVGAEMEKNIAETCCDAGTGGRVLGVQDIQSHLA